MALDLESVVKQLTESSIISSGKLKSFVPPEASPQSVDELIAELLNNNCLTLFQATQVKAGNANSLILGGYTIVDRIGAGGMGQVFKAIHRRMDRTVAIKVLPPAMTEDAAALARFEREAQAAAKLNHSNIVTAYDADQANGIHFLVMEYVDGDNLSTLVKANGPFDVARAVDCIVQAARGLEYAHKKGVIHRDIKPANLLLDREGTVKILDMGLARIESRGDSATQAELTGTGAVMGTIDFMPPEQALNTKDADMRADIYSLGCTLYYLLAGQPIYPAETLMAKLLAHREQPIPLLRSTTGTCPAQLDAVFRKMVAKQLNQRYQTMSDVLADLDACRTVLSQTGTPIVSRRENAKPTVDADRVLVAANDSMLEPNTFAVAGNILPLTLEKSHVASPRLHRAGPGSWPWIAGGVAAALALIACGIWIILRDKEGKEVARLQVPADGTIEMVPEKKLPPSRPRAPVNASAPGTPLMPPPVFGNASSRPTELELSQPVVRIVRGAPAASIAPIKAIDHGPKSNERVAFSPDGKRLVGTSGAIASVWDTSTWAVTNRLAGHKETLRVAAFSPQGDRLVTGGFDRKLIVWDVQSAKEITQFTGHQNNVFDAAFDPTGTWIASCSVDNSMRIWNAQTGEARLPSCEYHAVVSLAMGHDGKRIFGGSQNFTFAVWDPATGTRLKTIQAHAGYVSAMALSSDGKLLATGSFDKTVKLWDAESYAPIRTLIGHKGYVHSVAISPDGKRVASGGLDRQIIVWDTELGEPLAQLEAHTDEVRSLAFSPDGKRIASCSSDKSIKIWDVADVLR